MRVVKVVAMAGWVASALAITLVMGETSAAAQGRLTEARAAKSAATDMSAQSRRERQAATRIRVERYNRLPPNAVRSCNAWYEQERRPSGTVIVPRMTCRWING